MRKFLLCALAVVSVACIGFAAACAPDEGKTDPDNGGSQKPVVEEKNPWDDYNKKDWKSKYDVPNYVNRTFHAYTTVTANGNRNWEGYIKFVAARGSHTYQAEDAIWSGDVAIERDNGFVTYIDDGDTCYFSFESDYAGDVLITLGVATAPKDQVPEDSNGRAAKDYMRIYSGSVAEDADGYNAEVLEGAASTRVDISDCWIGGTRDWYRSEANTVGETTLTKGRNVIAIKARGGFNLDYMILTPAKDARANSIEKINYSGEPIRVEAEELNGELEDCRIEYDNARSNEGNIGFTTYNTSLSMTVTAAEDCLAVLSFNASFGPLYDEYGAAIAGSDLLGSRLKFKLNNKTLKLYDSGLRLAEDEEMRVSVGGADNWYNTYNTYTLPPFATLELKKGENTIEISSASIGGNYNIDYFELAPVIQYAGEELVIEPKDVSWGAGGAWSNDMTSGVTVLSGIYSVSFAVEVSADVNVQLAANYICGDSHAGMTTEQYNTIVMAAQYVSVNGEAKNYFGGFAINGSADWNTFGVSELCTLELKEGLNVITVGIDRSMLEDAQLEGFATQDMGIFLANLILSPAA